MKRKKVLMAGPVYWTSPLQVGTHHLARGFVKDGWDVAYISDPISLLHTLNGFDDALRERYMIYRQGGVMDCDERLWSYIPGALLTPHNRVILRSSWVHRKWHRLSFPNVVNQVAKNGFGEVDLLYLNTIYQAFWLDSIKYNKAIFRISDKISGFPRFTPAMLRLEKEIARRVDLVVYSAKSLESYVNALKPKCSLHLPNGVNFDHFAYGSKEMPPEYHTITKPIAIYVGSMEVWFDFDLVNYCARMLPYLSFVLIGPNKLARQHLDFLPNIYLLGSKKYRDLPSYLHNADVGIIPFDVKGHADLVHNVNPLKLYEYMACGLPVVSVGWEEISNLASPAILCDNPEAFVQGIKTTLLQSKRREPYIQYASRHTWSKRIYQMQEYLGTLL